MSQHKGAPSRAAKQSSRGSASHTPGAKKPRWSAEQRSAKGRAPQRPRGGEAAERRDRGEATESGRPNWEPRGKDARAGRPARFEQAERGDRRGGFSRDERGERAPRGERDARGEGFERRRSARAEFGERAGRGEYRGRNESDRGDFRGRDERGDRGEYRGRNDRGDFRGQAERGARRDRGEFRGRDERGDRGDRGGFRGREDRVNRAERFDVARRERSVRPDRVERPRPALDTAERYVPTPDVVLERLEATAIDATALEEAGFAELGLGENIVRALAELGADTPFPIQAGTIPAVLDGRDVLGRGRTGSGKTIAFGAPLVERLLRMQAGSSRRRQPGRAPRALVLAPTRELALQIDATIQPIARSVGLFTTQIYGGVPFGRQLGALDRGVDIIIGTPGRILDLAQRGTLDLGEIEIAVLDEADHMGELGFLEPVQALLRLTRPGGQRLLFSATLDAGVGELVEEFLVDPAVYEVAGEDQASGTIEHRVLLIDQRDKLAVLAEILADRERSLVFARTRAFAEQLADHLDEAGLDADAIHGDLNQSRRQRALDRFSRGRTAVLVATDVAARGIHVDDVDLVVQADAPDEYKAYLHRSGRTGRAGKEGTVVTLVARNRRRRVEELLRRAEIEAEWIPARPGDAILRELGAASA